MEEKSIISEMDDEYKIKAFEDIAAMFYNHNFGAATKSEIELLMFNILMNHMIDKHTEHGETPLDYNACSDYNIGKMLGIPQEKVRSLKIKKQARYYCEFDWKKSLERIKNRIVYDETKKKIIIPTPDPNLYNEIRNFIETKGGYIEIQRGSNVIQIRPNYFFMLIYDGIDDEKAKKQIRKDLSKKLREQNQANDIESILTDEGFHKKVLDMGDTVLSYFIDVAGDLQNPLVLILKGIKSINTLVRKGLK